MTSIVVILVGASMKIDIMRSRITETATIATPIITMIGVVMITMMIMTRGRVTITLCPIATRSSTTMTVLLLLPVVTLNHGKKIATDTRGDTAPRW